METRRLYVYETGDRKCPATGAMTSEYFISVAMPIISEGDLVGAVMSMRKEEKIEDAAVRDLEKKLIQTAAGFLSRHLEA